MSRPNILLITGDHMRHDALACNADPKTPHGLGHAIRTPNLDRLAAGGVTFRNSFTPNPICVPARASITTGNYPHRCTGRKSNSGAIRPDQPRLAAHFAAAGYATFAVGKLHYVPYSPPGQPPLLHGFQTAELCEEGRMIHQFDPLGERRGVEAYHDFVSDSGWKGYARAHGIGNNDVRSAPSPLPEALHEEAWVADRTLANLRAHRRDRPAQPFLLWASFSKPHPPYDPPRPWDTLYDPRALPPPLGDWEDDSLLAGRDPELASRRTAYGWQHLSREAVQVCRAYYGAMVTFQDAMIGRILDYLDEAGLADDTLVVYTADHGDLLGDFGRFFKTCFYDGAVKIPLLVRAPGVVPPGGSGRDQLAGLQDILPTLCALTGCPLDAPVDGLDLSPALRDPAAPGRPYYVAQTGEAPGQKYMVRTPGWKYLYSEAGGVEELYEVGRPSYELANLAGEPAFFPVLEGLRGTLLAWCIENGDTAMVREGRLAASPAAEGGARPFSPGSMGWRKY
jgi:arylsulfatase A-like enzyme